MAGALTRLRSYLGLDRNPLRRRQDRIEARIRLALAAILILGGPLLALWSAGHVHEDMLAKVHAQQASYHRVTAIVRGPGGPVAELDGGRQVVVKATALLPGGRDKPVRIAVPTSTKPGTHIPIWVNNQDKVVQRPLTPGDATWSAVLTGVMVPPMLAIATWAAAAGVRVVCMRHAEQEWELEWRIADLQWRGRPPR